MSALTLWARPTWEIDRWVKEGVLNGFTPAAEVVKDGYDAASSCPASMSPRMSMSRWIAGIS